MMYSNGKVKITNAKKERVTIAKRARKGADPNLYQNDNKTTCVLLLIVCGICISVFMCATIEIPSQLVSTWIAYTSQV